jgi:hypothetical protein
MCATVAAYRIKYTQHVEFMRQIGKGRVAGKDEGEVMPFGGFWTSSGAMGIPAEEETDYLTVKYGGRLNTLLVPCILNALVG